MKRQNSEKKADLSDEKVEKVKEKSMKRTREAETDGLNSANGEVPWRKAAEEVWEGKRQF